MLSSGSTGVWAASSTVTITATAKVDANRQVIIEGAISSGTKKQVTLRVMDAKGELEHLDQASSDEAGKFSFRYTLSKDVTATYNAFIGGDGVTELKLLTFTYTKNTNLNPNPPAGDGSSEADNAFIITEEQLKNARNGMGSLAVITVPDGKDELIVPINSGDLLGSAKLKIVISGLTLTIDSAVLKQLQQLPKADSGINISLKVKPLDEKETSKLLVGHSSKGLNLQAAGPVAELSLVVKTVDGELNLNKFDKPILVQLPYGTASIDASLLGVYYYNSNTKSWEYKGGKLSKSTKLINVELTQFSTYAVLSYLKSYSDVPASHWAHEAITKLSAKHVVKGVSDTTFSPGKAITRAEFTALLTRALGLSASKDARFKDVPAGSWYSEAVNAAYEAGIVKGMSAELFGPEKLIQREEMAVMLARANDMIQAVEKVETIEIEYSDSDEIASWAISSVQVLRKSGLMQGVLNNLFLPKKTATRAEAAQAISNLLNMSDSL